MTAIYIILYFVFIVLILSFSRRIAVSLAKKGRSLERIKQMVWNYIFGFILLLTIVLIVFIFLFEKSETMIFLFSLNILQKCV